MLDITPQTFYNLMLLGMVAAACIYCVGMSIYLTIKGK